MKMTFPVLSVLLSAGIALAADTAPTNQVADGISKLKSAANYSWTTTTKMVDSQFNIGPVKGQADKDGLAKYSQDFNGNAVEAVQKADKISYKDQEGAWKLIAADAGFETFFAASLTRNGAAAQEALITLTNLVSVKTLDDGSIGGDFTTSGAADMLSFGPRRPAGAAPAEGGFAPPAPKNASGSAKFWVKDGQLVKFETHLKGTVTFGDNEMNQDTTRTIEIADVGTTKLDIAADAKKLVEAK